MDMRLSHSSSPSMLLSKAASRSFMDRNPRPGAALPCRKARPCLPLGGVLRPRIVHSALNSPSESGENGQEPAGPTPAVPQDTAAPLSGPTAAAPAEPLQASARELSTIAASPEASNASGTSSKTKVASTAVAAGEGPSPVADPSIEAAEAALRSFARAAAEVFKLTVLLPLKYLVFAPLGWMFARLGLLAVNPGDVINRLEAANKSSQVDAAKVAEVLRVLNRHHPDAVVEFVESRGLLHTLDKEAAAAAGVSTDSPPFAVNVEVIKEYINALVKSGRIKDYVAADAAVQSSTNGTASGTITPGQTHRSLPKLLAELQAAASGTPVPTSPGQTTTWPLHVVLQNGGGSLGMGRQPTGVIATLQSVFWFFATCFLLGFTYAVGAAYVRRINGGAAGGSSLGINPGMGSGGGIAAAGPANMFGTKEYSKDTLPEKSVKKFADVKGVDEAIMELSEIVAYLKNPEKFTKLGGKLPKGVLLTGPPGTGKTLLARAVAGEAGVPFFYKAGSEFDEMFVGVGSRRVRNMFAAAKKKAPCIVFIDEIDAVGGKRTSWEGSGGSRKTLNQLLTDMDGFEENSGVVVMAATNLPELLDSALTRPGRFDRQVAVALPDVRGRQQIVELYLKGKPVAPDVDAQLIARRTPGFSGAQLANLVNEAALLAARHDKDQITASLLDEARDKVLMGSPRSLVQSEEARKLTAYHEGGHALVALLTPGAQPIHKATIVPRGHALGMVSQVPDKDEYSTTRQQMLAHIDVCMGGRAAEELIFGADHITSGATSDFKQATRMARHMVEDCGMSDRIGPVALAMGDPAAQGEETRRAVDEEVSALLKSAYQRVSTMLQDKEAELHKLAAALLEKETMTQKEIKQLLGLEVREEDEAASALATPELVAAEAQQAGAGVSAVPAGAQGGSSNASH